MPTKNKLEKLLEEVAKFVTKQKGSWDHDAWESMVAKAAAMGNEVNAEMTRHLGNMLEACKHFYAQGAGPAPAKKKAAKKKAAAKSKAKPKAKARR
jgi:hypothetical protein